MTSHYVSRYDIRLQLVQKALREHSDIDKKTSADLAVHVLRALDHIPEVVRQRVARREKCAHKVIQS